MAVVVKRRWSRTASCFPNLILTLWGSSKRNKCDMWDIYLTNLVENTRAGRMCSRLPTKRYFNYSMCWNRLSILSYLPIYLTTPPTYLPAYLPICLSTYLSTYQPAYRPTYLFCYRMLRRKRKSTATTLRGIQVVICICGKADPSSYNTRWPGERFGSTSCTYTTPLIFRHCQNLPMPVSRMKSFPATRIMGMEAWSLPIWYNTWGQLCGHAL